jgi:argininosuccinate synthase
VKLYKGSARTVARWSDHSLYSEAHVTFEEDAGAYDQKDAQGFIQLNALRLKLLAARDRRGLESAAKVGLEPTLLNAAF